jgi:DDE superfamily endonuclease
MWDVIFGKPNFFRSHISGTSSCSQILWINRFADDNGSICKISVDGTDFHIQEPRPFDRKWFSHKFKGPGVRYEVGVCLQTGDIVWTNGPFQCGSYPDGKIATEMGLDAALDRGERYVCDGGYYGPRADKPNGLNNADQYMKQVARSRHETVNARFKQFGVLAQVFRHQPEKHGIVFNAVAIITQLCLMYDQPLFQIYYNDRVY